MQGERVEDTSLFSNFFMELNVPTIVWKDRSEISRIRSCQFGALGAYPMMAILRNPISALSAHEVNFEGNWCPIELQNHDTAWDCKHSMKVLRPFNLGVNTHWEFKDEIASFKQLYFPTLNSYTPRGFVISSVGSCKIKKGRRDSTAPLACLAACSLAPLAAAAVITVQSNTSWVWKWFKVR